jgi:hypothetical protein
MKTGIQLITQERDEQIFKHRRSTSLDVQLNANYQLSMAASILCSPDWICNEEIEIIEDHCPAGWDEKTWEKMVKKPYKERLICAGALIAAEIDRLNGPSVHELPKVAFGVYKFKSDNGRAILFEKHADLPNGFVQAKRYCNARFLETGTFEEYAFNSAFVEGASNEETDYYYQLKARSPHLIGKEVDHV